ncbi:MAG TPA: efflux RND transporter periplasmic adaptor subunit [Thermoanaerobaculia bacterium]|nr:efflux RND transporter periplasmic adaptor subunit [Thermoanaerobaculia bacterium]
MIQETNSMDQIVTRGPGLSRRTKVWLAVAVTLAVALVLLWPAVRRWARAEQSVDLSRLQVASVVRGDLERDVSAQGRIVAANHPKLYSPTQGIVALAVRPGESVRVGQVLATIDSPEVEAALAQERSRLQSLESERSRTDLATRQQNQADGQTLKLRRVRLDAARRDLQRAEKLSADGLLNEVELERARDAVRVAEVELEQSQDGGKLSREARDFEVQDRRRQVERQRLVVADLERRLGELTLRAPFDGMVATIDVQDRDAVAPNAPVLTVVDLSEFEVEAQIPESYADEATPGTPAVVSFGGRDYPGELTSVSPEVQASQVQGTVKLKDVPPGLRQGQRVAVRLVFEKRPGVLKVPRGPFLEGGGRQVYVLADGLATLRPIEVGATSVSEVEIVKGLNEGDQVLLSDMEQFNGAETVLVRR